VNASTNQLRLRLSSASHLTFLTGAGISAESGIATFRSPDGIWSKFRPEELANIDAFMANPERVWEWYQYRRKTVTEAAPNAGHLALAELEKYIEKLEVITQNVDGLHQRAGSTHVYELHGSLLAHRCLDCDRPYELALDASTVPHCNACGGLIRPGVVWFGEMLPVDQWDHAEKAASKCDIFFVVGTSAVVYPAAQLPFIASHNGAFVVEINRERTEFSSYADLSLQGKAGDVLPELLEIVKEIRG
jgi:NAD-dependent deacetylase